MADYVIHPLMAMQLDRIVALTLPDMATILRLPTEPVSDMQGGVLSVPVVLYTNVPCRLEPVTQLSGQEGRMGEKVQVTTFWTVTFAVGQDITASDLIMINSRTFHVNGVEDPQSYDVEVATKCTEVG